MRALVTGGAGLIGSHLVDLLLKNNYEVKILDNLEKPTHLYGVPDWVPKDVDFIKGDMRHSSDLYKALDGVDVVFHQAAFGGFIPKISKYFDVNATGTARLLEIIRDKRLPIKKVVVASSQAVYGEGKYECSEHGVQYPGLRPLEQLEKGDWEVKCPVCGRALKPLPTDEETTLDCTTPYALSKYTEERIAINWGKDYGIPTVALRYSMTFGPRQSLTNPYTGVVSIFSTRILNGLPPVIYEDGNQLRDFNYVKDIARANLLVMEKDEANFKVFNVGTGKPTSVNEFVNMLIKLYNVDIKPEYKNQFRVGEVRHLYSDSSKIQALGYKPSYTIEQGLREYIEWIQQYGSVKEYFSRAEQIMLKYRIVRNVRR